MYFKKNEIFNTKEKIVNRRDNSLKIVSTKRAIMPAIKMDQV